MIISGLESINDIILIVQWKYLAKTNCRNLNVFAQHQQATVKLKHHFIFILSQTKTTILKNQKQLLTGLLVLKYSCSESFKGKLQVKVLFLKTAA